MWQLKNYTIVAEIAFQMWYYLCFQDFYIRHLRDGGLVRIRVDLLSAHVLSEFVMCPSPRTVPNPEDGDNPIPEIINNSSMSSDQMVQR